MPSRKHIVVSLAALALVGCSPRVPPKPDPATARIPRAEAIRMGRKAFENSGIPVRATDMTVAVFDVLPPNPLTPKAPGRPVWLVAFGPAGKRVPVGQKGFPYALIDDRTGKVEMVGGK